LSSDQGRDYLELAPLLLFGLAQLDRAQFGIGMWHGFPNQVLERANVRVARPPVNLRSRRSSKPAASMMAARFRTLARRYPMAAAIARFGRSAPATSATRRADRGRVRSTSRRAPTATACRRSQLANPDGVLPGIGRGVADAINVSRRQCPVLVRLTGRSGSGPGVEPRAQHDR
jgi:hypothetical protein